MHLFDSHAHLNLPEFDDDREEARERARQAGVTRMVNVGIDLSSSRTAREMAAGDADLYATAAIHPNYVAEAGPEGFAEVAAMVREGGFVAVGETGLDYYRAHSPHDMQRTAFRDHLRLAAEADLPVVIHCREAHEDCRRILAEEAERRDLRGRLVLHCFGGTPDDARAYLDLGAWISFSGTVTFRNADANREAARVVPLERTLIETDCPYLAPQPRRGQKNEPAFLVFTAEEIARLHGVSLAEAARVTTENTCAAFGIEVRA
jgi:TatD DNase family protein